MGTMIVWLLIATSSPGGYRAATFTVVDRYPTAADCAASINEIRSQKDTSAARDFEYRCIPAKVVRP